MSRWATRGAALALSVVLVACATPPRQNADLAGRLAVRVEAHDGIPAQSVSAQFELRGDAVAGDLRLTTPIGSTVAQARWQPGSAELINAGATRSFASLDALAQGLFGPHLPLAALIDWLRGRPWPGAPNAVRDGGFEQLGWQIDLTRFNEGWVLAARDQAPAVTVRARLDRPE